MAETNVNQMHRGHAPAARWLVLATLGSFGCEAGATELAKLPRTHPGPEEPFNVSVALASFNARVTVLTSDDAGTPGFSRDGPSIYLVLPDDFFSLRAIANSDLASG